MLLLYECNLVSKSFEKYIKYFFCNFWNLG